VPAKIDRLSFEISVERVIVHVASTTIDGSSTGAGVNSPILTRIVVTRVTLPSATSH
jgi:hypothetical protein